jgi:hypothetical protein
MQLVFFLLFVSAPSLLCPLEQGCEQVRSPYLLSKVRALRRALFRP